MYSYRKTFNEKQLFVAPAFPTPSHLQWKLIEFVSSNRESYFHLSKHVLKAAFFFFFPINFRYSYLAFCFDRKRGSEYKVLSPFPSFLHYGTVHISQVLY